VAPQPCLLQSSLDVAWGLRLLLAKGGCGGGRCSGHARRQILAKWSEGALFRPPLLPPPLHLAGSPPPQSAPQPSASGPPAKKVPASLADAGVSRRRLAAAERAATEGARAWERAVADEAACEPPAPALPPMAVVSLLDLERTLAVPMNAHGVRREGHPDAHFGGGPARCAPLRAGALPPGALVVYVTHRWLRPGHSPDNHGVSGVLYQALSASGRQLAARYRKQLGDVFFWFDYCSVPQADGPGAVQAHLMAAPLYAACSDVHLHLPHPSDADSAWLRVERLAFWALRQRRWAGVTFVAEDPADAGGGAVAAAESGSFATSKGAFAAAAVAAYTAKATVAHAPAVPAKDRPLLVAAPCLGAAAGVAGARTGAGATASAAKKKALPPARLPRTMIADDEAMAAAVQAGLLAEPPRAPTRHPGEGSVADPSHRAAVVLLANVLVGRSGHVVVAEAADATARGKRPPPPAVVWTKQL
jgi:hypothetical protein